MSLWHNIVLVKKDVPSAVGSRTVQGLGEVISGRSFPHIVQCVEATAQTCDLSVHRRQALPLAPGRPFNIVLVIVQNCYLWVLL